MKRVLSAALAVMAGLVVVAPVKPSIMPRVVTISLPPISIVVGWSNAPAGSQIVIFTNNVVAAQGPASGPFLTISNINPNVDYGEYRVVGVARVGTNAIFSPTAYFLPLLSTNHVVTFFAQQSSKFFGTYTNIPSWTMTLTNPPDTFLKFGQTNWYY